MNKANGTFALNGVTLTNIVYGDATGATLGLSISPADVSGAATGSAIGDFKLGTNALVPGNYVATLSADTNGTTIGNQTYEGKAYIPFTVDKFDLSKVRASLQTQELGDVDFTFGEPDNGNEAKLPQPVNVEYYPEIQGQQGQEGVEDGSEGFAAALAQILSLNYESSTAVGGTAALNERGTYTYTLAPAQSLANAGDTVAIPNLAGGPESLTYAVLSSYVTGSATVSVDVVGTLVPEGTKAPNPGFYYNSNVFGGELFPDTIYLDSTPASAQFASSSVVVYGPSYLGTKPLSPDLYTIEVLDTATGSVSGPEVLTTPGDYLITVKINASQTSTPSSYPEDPIGSYAFGGQSQSVEYNVSGGKVDAEESGVTFNGKTVENKHVNTTYNGENQLNNFVVTLKDTSGALVPNEDYNMRVVNNATGTVVNEAVNAGEYTVSFSSSTYEGVQTLSPITLTINPIEITNPVLTGSQYGYNFFGYTGNPISTGVGMFVDGELVTLPEAVYEITYYSGDNELSGAPSEIGNYDADITIAEGENNYTISPDPCQIELSIIDKVFADVPTTGPDGWAAPYIYEGYVLGYMNGYGNGSIFGPNNPLERQQAAVLLFNMGTTTSHTAGQPTKYDTDVTNNPDFDKTSVVMPFTDETRGDVYNAAILWVKDAGLMKGYASTNYTTFGPSANITRAEFATIMYRYATMTNTAGTPLTDQEISDTLAKFPDGDTVPDYAREAVAWAATKPALEPDSVMMGNSGWLAPDANITRAEAIKMAITVQPENIAAPFEE